MKLNFEEEMLINDKANTVPGIAYPIPARLLVSLRNKLLFNLLAKESIRENSMVINAVMNPKLIVLNDRVSNSMDKPFWI